MHPLIAALSVDQNWVTIGTLALTVSTLAGFIVLQFNQQLAYKDKILGEKDARIAGLELEKKEILTELVKAAQKNSDNDAAQLDVLKHLSWILDYERRGTTTPMREGEPKP